MHVTSGQAGGVRGWASVVTLLNDYLVELYGGCATDPTIVRSSGED